MDRFGIDVVTLRVVINSRRVLGGNEATPPTRSRSFASCTLPPTARCVQLSGEATDLQIKKEREP
jgi:hypothetical protein